MDNRSILNSWSENNKKKFLAVRNKFKEYNESLQIEDLNEANLVKIAKFFQKYWKNNSTFIKRWQDIRAFFRNCKNEEISPDVMEEIFSVIDSAASIVKAKERVCMKAINEYTKLICKIKL